MNAPALAACLALALEAALAQRSEVVDPLLTASPSERYVLAVEPGQRTGAGPAHYRVADRGTTLWEATLPVTLHEAGITDDGTVFGYGDSEGLSPSTGETVIWILEEGGRIRLEERLPRAATGRAPSRSTLLGLVRQDFLDQLVVRCFDPQRPDEVWMRWSLHDGARLQDLVPRRSLGRVEGQAAQLLAAGGVPGTGLFLSHWLVRTQGASRKPAEWGAAFVLMDKDGGLIWRLDLRDDYSSRHDIPLADLQGWLGRFGAIRIGTAAAHFDILEYKDARRRSFQIVEDDTAGAPGLVEVASEAFHLPWSTGATPDLDLPLERVSSLPEPIRHGEGPESEAGRRPEDPWVVGERGVLENGRLYVEDAAARAVNVWNEDLQLMGTLEGPLVAAALARYEGRVVPDEGGSVWIDLGSGDLMGLSEGRLLLRGTDPSEAPSWIARTGARWAWSRTPGRLVRYREGQDPLELLRGPGGAWLKDVVAVSTAPSGAIAVLETLVPMGSPIHAVVHYYTGDGAPRFSVDVAGSVGRWVGGPDLRSGDRWSVLGGSGPQVVLVDQRTRSVRRFAPPEAVGATGTWAHGISTDGRRLLSMNATALLLYEYLLPAD